MSESKCGRAGCRDGMMRVQSLIDPDDTVMDLCPYCAAAERRSPVLTFATLQQSTSDQFRVAGRKEMRDRIAQRLASVLGNYSSADDASLILDNLWDLARQIAEMDTR